MNDVDPHFISRPHPWGAIALETWEHRTRQAAEAMGFRGAAGLPC